MSIKLMAHVWDRFPGHGSDLIAMLAFADYANDDGDNIFPSVDTMAKRMRLSRRQTQRVIGGLLDEGWIQLVGNQYGGAPGTTRHYRLSISKLLQQPLFDPPRDRGDTEVTGDADDTGVMCAAGRAGKGGDVEDTGDADVTGDSSGTGDSHDTGVISGTGVADGADGCRPRRERVSPVTRTGVVGVTQTVIKPSLQPSVKPTAGAPPLRAAAPFIRIPLVNDTDYPIAVEQVAEWKRAYPAVDIGAELNAIRQWAIRNPGKRKSRSIVLQHIVGWIERKQARGRSELSRAKPVTDAASRDVTRRAREQEARLSHDRRLNELMRQSGKQPLIEIDEHSVQQLAPAEAPAEAGGSVTESRAARGQR